MNIIIYMCVYVHILTLKEGDADAIAGLLKDAKNKGLKLALHIAEV